MDIQNSPPQLASQFSARPSPWISQLSCNARSSTVPALAAQPLWLSKRCHQRRLSRPNKGSNRAAKRRLVDTEKARYSTGVKVAMQMSQCLQVDWCLLVFLMLRVASICLKKLAVCLWGLIFLLTCGDNRELFLYFFTEAASFCWEVPLNMYSFWIQTVNTRDFPICLWKTVETYRSWSSPFNLNFWIPGHLKQYELHPIPMWWNAWCILHLSKMDPVDYFGTLVLACHVPLFIIALTIIIAMGVAASFTKQVPHPRLMGSIGLAFCLCVLVNCRSFRGSGCRVACCQASL